MVRPSGLLAALILANASLGAAGPASAAERIGLVIGNSNYQNAEVLPNPKNDAEAIGAALVRVGFEVEVASDLDQLGMLEAFRNFGLKAESAQVALVFYAGHGIQVAGENYLLPVDARLERERDLLYEALPLNVVLGEVAQAERLGPGTLSRFAEIVHTGLVDMRGATAPRLLLELLCARMLLPGAVPTDAAADSAVLQRLERIERRVTATASAPARPAAQPSAQQPSVQQPDPTPAPPPEPPKPAEQPPVAAPSPDGAIDAAAVRRLWSELLGAVRKNSRSTEAMLTNATVQSVDGDTVVIAHTAAPLARRLAEPRNVDAIAQALGEVLGGQWQVKCVHAEQAGAATPAQPPKPADPPTYTRPTQPQRPAEPPKPPPTSPSHLPAPQADDIPPPPEPPAEDAFYGNDQPAGPPPGTPPNPEADMVKLLTDRLGARPLDH